MQTGANTDQNRKRVRHTRWARLWLACIAAILTWSGAEHTHAFARRRANIAELPPALLARLVVILISLCTCTSECCTKTANRPHNTPRRLRRANPRAQARRAYVRIVLTKLRLHRASIADIAHLCANPDRAIARLNAFFVRGATRRRAIIFTHDIATLLASAAAPAPQTADSS